MRAGTVARVDPEDDSVRRYVVHHYRYDPERHERRNVVVAAFDSSREFDACFRATSDELESRRAAGEDVDPREHVSGTTYEPGARRRAANGRLVVRALRHGVALGPWIDELEMPSNMALLRVESGPARRPRRSLISLRWRWRRGR
jgi:hypothetical protein